MKKPVSHSHLKRNNYYVQASSMAINTAKLIRCISEHGSRALLLPPPLTESTDVMVTRGKTAFPTTTHISSSGLLLNHIKSTDNQVLVPGKLGYIDLPHHTQNTTYSDTASYFTC